MARNSKQTFRSIDLHSHVLPDLDDGAATLLDSLALARELAASGVRVAAATPHVSTTYPTTPAQIVDALRTVRTALERVSLELEVVSGAEVSLESLGSLDSGTLRALTFGGTGASLLVEFPYEGWPTALPDALDSLAAAGITPLLAHPERNPVVQAAPQRLAGVVDAGALVQVNAGSLTGAFGTAAAKAAHSLLETELVHVIASDAHRAGGRPMASVAAAQLPHALATWLVWDVPAAILRGDPPPPRPPRRRGLRLRR
jgi:protein-tyrosine phosphatase